MPLSSLPFLYYFFPLTLVAWFTCPRAWRPGVLLAASLIFYGWGEGWYVLLLLACILNTYLSGRLLAQFREAKQAKAVLGVSLGVSLALLVVFRYWDAFLSLPVLQAAHPLGIAFYTLRGVGYLLDVYRGKRPPEKHLLPLALYFTLFPTVTAGPLLGYGDFTRQLGRERDWLGDTAQGARRFVLGLGKKRLLADPLFQLSALCQASQDPSVLSAWLFAIALVLYLYFDLSGYSDMAIGLGKIFGFDLPENFQVPFLAKTCTDFFQRWMATLGGWFRDYVYFPLGGAGRPWALVLTWLLAALWHGLRGTFLAGGLFFALFMLLEQKGLAARLTGTRVLGRIYLLAAALVGLVLFASADLPSAGAALGSLLGVGGLPLVSPEALYQLKSSGVVLALALVGATPLPTKVGRYLAGTRAGVVLEPLALGAILLVSTAFLADGTLVPCFYTTL